MFPAANAGAGQNMGFPDVCNTPIPVGTAPIPYPNIAMNAMATNFSATVRISSMNALNIQSRIPMTSGMEAGVAHSSIVGEATYTKGSAMVTINGAPAVAQILAMGTGNRQNCPSTNHLVPSATTVLIAM